MNENNIVKDVICEWTARKIHPIILVYVSCVFIAFIILSYFVFNSITAVKTLLFTAIGSIGPLIPGTFTWIDYKLTKKGLFHGKIVKKKAIQYKKLFNMNQLSHIKPIQHGFKYYLKLSETNRFCRLWKKYFSSEFSGAIHVEKVDLIRVLNYFALYKI